MEKKNPCGQSTLNSMLSHYLLKKKKDHKKRATSAFFNLDNAEVKAQVEHILLGHEDGLLEQATKNVARQQQSIFIMPNTLICSSWTQMTKCAARHL